jgi:hypothetical protein
MTPIAKPVGQAALTLDALTLRTADSLAANVTACDGVFPHVARMG